jgi:hypothetical protein
MLPSMNDFECSVCNDVQWVCEDHPSEPWGHSMKGRKCVGAGMPCPICNPSGGIDDPPDLPRGFKNLDP